MRSIIVVLIVVLGASTIIPACSRPPDERESFKNFLVQSAELQRDVSAKEVEWRQRFTSLPMGNVLLPKNLVTPQGRALGKATLEQFRALIAERAANRKDASNKFRQAIAAIPNKDVRESVRAGADAHHRESVKSAEEMDQAQLHLANAYDAILNWCEEEGVRLKVKENQLKLSTPAQQAQLDSLLSTLEAAEKREDESVSRMEDIQRQSQRR